jgi:hypothetical protein
LRTARPLLLAAALASACAATALAQEIETPPPAAPTGQPEGRPGLWRLGPVYLTPTFHVGNVGVDTNVLFQSEDRRRDFSVSGGPGLDLVIPATRSFRVLASSTLDYLYFANNVDQRRLSGAAQGGLRFDTGAFLAGGQYLYNRTFDRPDPQVDDRVDQTQQQARAELGLWGGARRFGVSSAASKTRYDIDAGQIYLGSDLRAALARDESLVQLAFRYGLTPKTSLLLNGDYEWDRFLLSPIRDADSNRAMVGFEVLSDTRLSGRALGGVRSFRPKRSDASRLMAVGDVTLTYSVSPKTRFEGRYRRDFDYSAFITSGTTPTVTTEAIGLGFTKVLVARLDLRVVGSLNKLISDGEVLLVLPDQGPVVTLRKDHYWQGGADLGYTFGERLRVGVAATYADRNSTVSYFGVQGLVMGATITYSGTPTVVLHP